MLAKEVITHRIPVNRAEATDLGASVLFFFYCNKETFAIGWHSMGYNFSDAGSLPC